MAKRTVLPLDEWQRSLNEVHVSKDDMNRLVLDYLIIEGYKDAAARLALEANLEPNVDLDSIENRMLIRAAIQRGDVEDAIGRVNELDPEILDTHPVLFFHLQQQRLIELIRAGSLEEALLFASEELAPRGEEHPNLLPELERTMALLAFTPVNFAGHDKSPAQGTTVPLSAGLPATLPGPELLGAPEHISALLHPSQRLRTATELNAAILASQSQGTEPKLPKLLRVMYAGEDLLSTAGKVDFPNLDIARYAGASQQHASAIADGARKE
ncbi:hypothetical protein IE81DRAFT_324843 [Ceraceosorus guamensis]|uniref:CTLH domain-containing protein n=1 Tax=Ceraceosorus guamensis TaxID=1522189 RepID=A0A316VUF3_9BASI|nr:hypothetical protein IE81DRAFT_324843 [Ceraceosorus guamensis]PWN41122.1 hypothetical protein IE81DRAFT_324843 [Ceraceosorus guamensis]